jgi:hypothetical protein
VAIAGSNVLLLAQDRAHLAQVNAQLRLRASTPLEHAVGAPPFCGAAAGPCGLHRGASFWLGHVARADFDAVLATKVQKAPQASGHNAEQRASITIVSQRQSWLGAYVKWVSFGALDKAWWDTHVTGRMSAGHARGGVSGGVSSGQGRPACLAVGAMP